MWSGKTLINKETGIFLSKAGAHFGRFASSMQASYASGYALGLPHRMLGTQKSMKTVQYAFACFMRTFSKATEARSAVVAGQTGGARTTERTNRHDVPSPCRTPSVRPPTSDCRPQGGHPCIERMRDAHVRSNIPQTASEAF